MLAEREATRRERLTPLGRLEALCDSGSLELLRTQIASRSARSAPGDGVVAGAGTVGGRPVYCYAQDQGFAGGSLGTAQAETIVRVLELAGRASAPVVGYIASGGARIDEGAGALGGYGAIFRRHVALSGRVPQISVITGTSAGGGAYSPALTDFVVMTEGSRLFLTGPAVVEEVMGENVTMDELGGPRVHSRNGVCDLVAEDDHAAAELVRDLLGHLPQSSAEQPATAIPQDPFGSDPGAAVPSDPRKVYDVRTVIRSISDSSSMLELSPRWARNMVTALTRLNGHPVGVIANQPHHLGGVIDTAASEKAASFIRRCDSFGLPLVVLVDTPGFLPGTKQEGLGVIRHGAGLLHAFSAARVPKVTVVLRKAYGGGFITMNSRDLGADLVLAWPGAEIGVLGARQAVGIVHRRAIEAAPDPGVEHDRLAAEYAEQHLSAEVAAAAGDVDEVIEPADTRARLTWALSVLGTSIERNVT
ncbi:MAG TPA: acyl-CoA carboxylase subunit beta [Solirubrobacterales bacterium]|nr:acyl-CoA carboxylase subunit beta [Solirubrobacterales bacterium]